MTFEQKRRIELFNSSEKPQYNKSREIIAKNEHKSELPLIVAQDARDRIKTIAASSPEKKDLACCAGCWYCCTMPVDVTAPEAIAIVNHLRHKTTSEELLNIKNRVEQAETSIRQLTAQQQLSLATRCTFLGDDNQCSIYEVRPLTCIAFTSKSLDACKAMHASPSDLSLEVPDDQQTKSKGFGVIAGLRRALHDSGLDAGHYDLNSAVRLTLANDRAGIQWASGNKNFEKNCLVRDSSGHTG